MIESLSPRRATYPVRIGAVTIGGNSPIVMQSMVTEHTTNIVGVTKQIIDLHLAGAEIVRVTTPTMKDANSLGEVKIVLKKQYQDVPIVADVHHQGSEIAVKVTEFVDKVRINPGLFVFKKHIGRVDYTQTEIDDEISEIDRSLRPLVGTCKERGVAMRIGVNHGSLSERLMVTFGDTPEGMVESAMEYIKICESYGFRELVISLKASRVPVMIAANRLMVARMKDLGMNYPLHLGVTEAGDGQVARIKSAAGIATLLSEGIGDTIRVSLAENPINELDVCKDILQSLGLRKDKAEFIACPSCGRTQFDLPSVLGQVKEATGHLKELSIAVMGCVVNGLGEMADADYGFVGKGGGIVALYKGKEAIRLVPEEKALGALIDLIKEDGRWVDFKDNY